MEKNILLVIPRENSYIHREALIPPGIAYINGALRAAGLSVTSVNLNFAEGEADSIVADLVREHEISYIMSGGTALSADGLRQCFDAARSVKRDVICIGGGAGYTSEPELFCKMSGADIAVLGEGEETSVELLKTLMKGGELSGVAGIIYFDGKNYVKTAERPPIRDLDVIAFPSYEGLGLEEYFEKEKNYDTSALFDYSYTEEPRVIPMFLGRSCPFGCKFCFHTIGRKYRTRSLDNFFAELDMWIEKYRINGILLMDELFGGKESFILEFCKRMKEYHMNWVAEIRVELASREVLQAMADSGCTYLQLGLESMAPEVLADMEKRIRPEQIAEALRNSYELKIHVFGNFIFGAEAETFDTFLKTFDWWNRHRKYQIRLLNILLYPGSQYYRNTAERGLIKDKERFIQEGMPGVNMSKMSEFEWDKMKRIIRMTNTDNVFFGRITRVTENKDDLTLQIKCCHCKEDFIVEHVKKEKRFSMSNMLSVCPHCGRNNNYNFDDFQDIMQYEVMTQWINNEIAGYDMKSRLKKQGYSRIGIWGSSAMAEFFAKEYSEDVEITCVTAESTERMSEYSYLGRNIKIIEPEQLQNENLDAVIVTDVSEYTGSCDKLRAFGYQGTIDSLVNFVFDMEYHLLIPGGMSREKVMECDDTII